MGLIVSNMSSVGRIPIRRIEAYKIPSNLPLIHLHSASLATFTLLLRIASRQSLSSFVFFPIWAISYRNNPPVSKIIPLNHHDALPPLFSHCSDCFQSSNPGSTCCWNGDLRRWFRFSWLHIYCYIPERCGWWFDSWRLLCVRCDR